MKKNKIILKPAIHRKKEVICIVFVYDERLKTILQKMHAKWSATLKCWYIFRSDFKLNTFYQQLKPNAFIDYELLKTLPKKVTPTNLKSQLSDESKAVANQFYLYLKGKRYSESTLKTYTYLIAEFLLYHKKSEVTNKREIELFLENVYVPKQLSISTQRQFISGMNHYLTYSKATFKLDFKTDSPRKDRKLPNVLSKEEVIRLIQVTKNLKHRLCITLIYSSGLRIGELLNLQLKDIDFDRNLLRIEMAKGRKDRYVPIANTILPMLNNYLNTYEPKKYLIENDTNNTQYSPNSVRKFLKSNLKKAKIKKHVTPHTLRHSYATHLLESGTDIRYIQQLLGHNDPKTTMIYTHVQSEALQKIKNPLDLIVAQFNNQKKIT